MEAMSSGTQKPTLATLTSQFEKAHPNITVKLVTEPDYATLRQKEEAAVAAGSPPTLGQAYENWAASYASSQAIVPLTSFVSGSDGITSAAKAQIWKGVWKDLHLPDGKVWMWPFNKSDYVVFYNSNMLQKAGVSVPTTWAQYAKVAKKLTTGNQWAESIDTGTLSAPQNGTYVYLSIVSSYGGQWVSNGKPNLDSPAAVKALTYLQGLQKEGALKIGTNYPGQTALGAGHGAFDISTVAAYPYDLKAVGKKFTMKVAAVPSGPAGQGNAMEGTNLVIFSKATPAEQAAAWSYMKWLSEPKQTAYWAEQTGYLPVTKAALPLMSSYISTHPIQKIAADALQHATGTPPYAWWTQAVGQVGQALQAVLVNGQSPSAALKSAQSQAMAAAG
ncbi:MAG: ABC transporter substrate-binding protein [Acidimicrobiales bacterium]